MVYEGIHRLCFSCGKIGHMIETCPLTIKKPEAPVEGGSIGGEVERSTNPRAFWRGTHDSYSTDTGSGTLKNRDVGTGEDGYDPWMLVARRRPRQKRTNLTVATEDHAGHSLNQSVHGPRQEPKGDTRGWLDIKKGAEAVGPSNVGRVTFFGSKKVDDYQETRFSPSVKGKRVLARNRATKMQSKLGVGYSNTNSGGSSLGKGGDGKCADEPFKFQNYGQTEVGVQDRRQFNRVFRGGSVSSWDGLSCPVGGANMEEALPVDGGQCKDGFLVTKISEEQSNPSGEVQSSDQASASTQQSYRGDGGDFGIVGVVDNSVSKEGKVKGEDGIVGMEFEMGRGDFISSD